MRFRVPAVHLEGLEPGSRRIGGVSPLPPRDPAAALNEVLNEVIDVVRDVKQARWRVARTHELHIELDALFDDLRAWAGLLLDEDEALGLSPLTFMPSPADRRLPNAWAGTASDDEVRRVVREHLERLAHHLAAALAEQRDGSARAALAEVERGLTAHRQALGAS
jgi:hypothetical protein